MCIRNIKFIFFGFILLFSINANAASLLDQLFHQTSDPMGGNPKGNVTLVEFFDYQCGHCINMAHIVQDTIKHYPNLRVIFKEYPIRGATSVLAARAALAANLQGKYYPFSHALLTADVDLNENTIFKIAKSSGLDVKRLKKDMDSPAIKNKISENYDLAKELDISGTPAFFIGNTDAKNTEDVTFVLGEMSQSEIDSAIKKSAS